MRSRGFGGALLAVIVIAAAGAGGVLVCGKTGASRSEPSLSPSLEGTLCEVIAKAPPAHPHGPLPTDPALAAWTAQVEGALEEVLAVEAMVEAHGHQTLPEREAACARKLWTTIAANLPAQSPLRRRAEETLRRSLREDAGGPEGAKLALAIASPPASRSALPSSAGTKLLERALAPRTQEPECQDAAQYLSPFPANARLRRALIMHFSPCLYDNFSSMDGALDRTEIFMRETASSWPDRASDDALPRLPRSP